MDELKSKAAPKTNELIKVTKEQNELLDVQIVLLDRLCTLKENQQNKDDTWRASWWKAKVLDTRVSIVVLFIAVAGVSFDVIKINGDSLFIASIAGLFN